MSDKLTTKQQLFVEAYLANPNATEAARQAGYKGNAKTLSVVGAENLAKPCIRTRLEKRVEEAVVTANEVLRNVKNIAESADQDAVRLKGWELLGKHLAMWTERTETVGETLVKVEYVDGN